MLCSLNSQASLFIHSSVSITTISSHQIKNPSLLSGHLIPHIAPESLFTYTHVLSLDITCSVCIILSSGSLMHIYHTHRMVCLYQIILPPLLDFTNRFPKDNGYVYHILYYSLDNLTFGSDWGVRPALLFVGGSCTIWEHQSISINVPL